MGSQPVSVTDPPTVPAQSRQVRRPPLARYPSAAARLQRERVRGRKLESKREGEIASGVISHSTSTHTRENGGGVEAGLFLGVQSRGAACHHLASACATNEGGGEVREERREAEQPYAAAEAAHTQ